MLSFCSSASVWMIQYTSTLCCFGLYKSRCTCFSIFSFLLTVYYNWLIISVKLAVPNATSHFLIWPGTINNIHSKANKKWEHLVFSPIIDPMCLSGTELDFYLLKIHQCQMHLRSTWRFCSITTFQYNYWMLYGLFLISLKTSTAKFQREGQIGVRLLSKI